MDDHADAKANHPANRATACTCEDCGESTIGYRRNRCTCDLMLCNWCYHTDQHTDHWAIDK